MFGICLLFGFTWFGLLLLGVGFVFNFCYCAVWFVRYLFGCVDDCVIW